MKRRLSVWSTVVMAVATTVGVTGLILRALYEVVHNRGSEIYRNVYGIRIQWITVLTTLGAVAAALLVAWVARILGSWRETREIRVLIRRANSRKREDPRVPEQ